MQYSFAYAVFFNLDELPLNMQQKFYKKTNVFSCARTKLGGEAIKLQNFTFKDYS